MSSENIQKAAEEVRSFFQYNALCCEQIAARNMKVPSLPTELQGAVSLGAYVQSRALSCAALAGLSFIWEALDNPTYPFGGSDTERFICFLHQKGGNSVFSRVATPFLHRTLERQDIEPYFRDAVFNKWVKRESDYRTHYVSQDPLQQEVKDLYLECVSTNPVLPNDKQLRNVDHAIFTVTYAGLIYKLFRNPFAHEFHPSQHTSSIGKPGEPIRVLQFTGIQVPTEMPSGEYIYTLREYIDENTGRPVTLPFLDVPITILTDAIREGAETAYNLILREGYIPYGYDEGITFKTK